MTRGTLAVLLVALVLSGVHALVPPEYPLDEFLPLVAAQRLLAGEVPYRDFTTLYPPLTALVDAVVIALAGPSVPAARLVFVALSLLGASLVKVLAKRLSASERTATLVGLLAATAQGAPHWGYALVLAGVLALSALACALRPGPRWTVAAGALLGLASLARHDAALFAAIPIGALVLSRSRRELLVLLAVAAVPGLAFVALLAAAGALGDALHQLVVIPATLYPRIRGLPAPLPWSAARSAPGLPSLATIYGPFVVSALALGHAWRSGRDPSKLACAALPFFLGLSAIVRPDRAHLAAAALASFAALSLLHDAKKRWLLIALALTLPVAGRELVEAARAARRVASPRPDPAAASRDRALARVATRPAGSRIFVALPQHRRIWINDVGFYFQAQALPATRHHELYALVATTGPVQEEIVRDLERWRPPFVVVAPVKIVDEPNASAETSSVRVLDDYIATHYELDMDDERYRVLRRRP